MADAVVFPGGTSAPPGPLLWYASEIARRRGATVHRHAWSETPWVPWEQFLEQVSGEIAGVLDAVGGTPLLIGKSRGTVAATAAADRSLPAVWLTPLLTDDRVVAALGRASAPFLLVGGVADEWWDGAAARRLSPYVLEVAGADHSMAVPGA